MQPRVSILVLNWNNWKDTNECLVSLQQLEYENWKVTIVDNGSTDGSVEQIRKQFPEVDVLELGDNLGFAKGNNAGIQRALEQGAEYVWLLNNDTTVESGALRSLVERAEGDLRVGAVGSAIYYAAEQNRLQAWGGGYVNFWLGGSHHFLRPVPDEKIQFLMGASLLLRRSALETLGLLDEAFFLYWEDSDYCFRLRQAGWRLTVAMRSKVYHKVNATTGKGSVSLDLYYNRSARRFFQKHAPFPQFSFWTGVLIRTFKRAILGKWENLHAVWSGARSGPLRIV